MATLENSRSRTSRPSARARSSNLVTGRHSGRGVQPSAEQLRRRGSAEQTASIWVA